MLPSLLARDIQQGLQQFLVTGFEPSDNFLHGLMRRFVEDQTGWLKRPYKSLFDIRRSVSAEELMSTFEISRATLNSGIAKLRDQLNVPILFDCQLGVYVIEKGMDNHLQAINNPLAAENAQSILVSSNAVLTSASNMTCPPVVAKLDKMAKRLRQKSEAYIEVAPTDPIRDARVNNGPGILGTLGELSFGAGLTKLRPQPRNQRCQRAIGIPDSAGRWASAGRGRVGVNGRWSDPICVWRRAWVGLLGGSTEPYRIREYCVGR